MLQFMVNHSAADLSVPTVIITAGLPAAGKSSLCAHLFPDEPTLSADDIKTEHPDFDPKDQNGRGQDIHRWSLDQFEVRRARLLATRATHILDSTATEIAKVSRWIDEARAAGFKVHVLMVNCSLETVLERNAARDRVVPVWAIKEKAAVVRESFAALVLLADSSEEVPNDPVNDMARRDRAIWGDAFKLAEAGLPEDFHLGGPEIDAWMEKILKRPLTAEEVDNN